MQIAWRKAGTCAVLHISVSWRTISMIGCFIVQPYSPSVGSTIRSSRLERPHVTAAGRIIDASSCIAPLTALSLQPKPPLGERPPCAHPHRGSIAVRAMIAARWRRIPPPAVACKVSPRASIRSWRELFRIGSYCLSACTLFAPIGLGRSQSMQ